MKDFSLWDYVILRLNLNPPPWLDPRDWVQILPLLIRHTTLFHLALSHRLLLVNGGDGAYLMGLRSAPYQLH